MSSVGSRAEFPKRVYSPTQEEQFEYPESVPLHPRRPSSYEEMNGEDGYTRDGQLHQYEDPRLLAEQMRRMKNNPPPCNHEVRPRKKANDLYERYRTESDGSSETSKNSSRCRGAMCFGVCVSLLFGLAAVALVTLMILGHLVPSSCEGCLKVRRSGIPHTGSSTTPNQNHLERLIKSLQANLTELHKIVRHRDEVIKKLLETDKSHTEQLNILFRNQLSDILKNSRFNVTAQLKRDLKGERGPRGFKGERGPPGINGEPGSGNISACVYKSNQAKFSPSPSSGYHVFAMPSKGWVIISAVCSSDGAAESNLSYLQGRNGYRCRCIGISAGNSDRRTATCYIHYWQCPKL